MYKIFGEVIKVIENTMENSRMELTAEGKNFADVNIQRNSPGRCSITTTICNNDDATESHS